jgi:catechol 2,3-dioxygenase-like lactoylglutathione lyase family enzyme
VITPGDHEDQRDQRAALTLRYLDGLPVAEVAACVGRSVHATETLLARARAALRRIYRDLLGFDEELRPSPAFAMLNRGDLRLLLSVPGGGPGGGAATADGTLPEPGRWNRIALQVTDLAATVDELRGKGASFRNDIVTGTGVRQILIQDPSGNLIELFEPLAAYHERPPRAAS